MLYFPNGILSLLCPWRCYYLIPYSTQSSCIAFCSINLFLFLLMRMNNGLTLTGSEIVRLERAGGKGKSVKEWTFRWIFLSTFPIPECLDVAALLALINYHTSIAHTLLHTAVSVLSTPGSSGNTWRSEKIQKEDLYNIMLS